MGDHDVSVEGDGEHGEERRGHERVPRQREQATQQLAVRPRAPRERGPGQRQVEAAEQQVRAGQAHYEDRSRVAHLETS